MASRIASLHLRYHYPLPRVVLPAAADRAAPRLRAALGLLLLIGVIALAAPALTPYDPSAINPSARMLPPGPEHLLGTDMFGRDLLSRILYGTQPTLAVALGAVLIGVLPGALLGLLAGSRRGLLDHLLTQVIDAWIALPGVLVALVMIAAFGRALLVLALALGLSSLPMFYRIVRAETMRVSAEPFVEAAVSLGARRWEILLRHIFPNVLPVLLALVTVSIGRMLLATSALSFIGLGAPPPSPEWGSLLAEGRSHMEQSWWLIWFPGAALAFTTFAFYLFGNALRDRQSAG